MELEGLLVEAVHNLKSGVVSNALTEELCVGHGDGRKGGDWER
jgi:hypothetical protein